jgi:hypothetical protein
MTVGFIGLGLIMYSNFYKLILKTFKVKTSLHVACMYILLGVTATSIAVYCNFKTSSTGEFMVYLMCIIGAIVRVGYAHFKLQKSLLSS